MTATSATLSFSQPTNSLSVDIYTVTLTGTACNGVPIRTGSTTSNSVTIDSLEAGIEYSINVTGRNIIHNLTNTRTTTRTMYEAGKFYNIVKKNCKIIIKIINSSFRLSWSTFC